MSEEEGEHPKAPPLEMVVRTLRHEVGDLLQSVYSAVAILQERLPRGQTLERTVLGDLRNRAEMCKNELDAAHDLICPLTVNPDWLDLSELAHTLTAAYAARYPALRIVCEAPNPVKVWADVPRMNQAGAMLLTSLCPAARAEVTQQIRPAEDGATEWSFSYDGPPPGPDQLRWLTEPFATTRHARFGLSLAFARRVTELHGGRTQAEEGADGRFRVALILPRGPEQVGRPG